MCTARLCSQGVDLFALNFTWTGSSPINHSWRQKTRDRFPCFDIIPECDGRTDVRLTDGQSDGFAVAYTALAKLCMARCKSSYSLATPIYYYFPHQ